MAVEKKTIQIVGAGFSGLTCAYYLVKAGFDVEVIEKSARVGGLLGTTNTPYGLVETAANAFMNSQALVELAKEIGLTLLTPKRESRARFVFRGRPMRFPVRPSELFSLLRFIFKMVFFRDSLLPRSQESLRHWGIRSMGQNLSHYTIETALQGIYAGNPEKISALLVLENFFKAKKSTVPSGSRAPRDGMIEFVDKLQSYLKLNGVKFTLSQEANVFKEVNRPTVLALPAYEARALLEVIEPELSSYLAGVDYLPVITANIFFNQSNISLEGFGCLFAPEESNLVLGVLINQSIFENRTKNAASENWIMGGAFVQNRKEFIAKSDHEVIELALAKRRLLKPTEMSEVIDAKITRWPKAFPAYTLELEMLLPKLKPHNKNIFLHGNYLGDLGLTKILDRSARLAEQIKADYA